MTPRERAEKACEAFLSSANRDIFKYEDLVGHVADAICAAEEAKFDEVVRSSKDLTGMLRETWAKWAEVEAAKAYARAIGDATAACEAHVCKDVGCNCKGMISVEIQELSPEHWKQAVAADVDRILRERDCAAGHDKNGAEMVRLMLDHALRVAVRSRLEGLGGGDQTGGLPECQQ